MVFRKTLRLLGLILFAYILTQVDVGKVVAVYRDSDLVPLALVVLLFYPTIWFRSLRWQRLLPKSGARLTQKQLFRSYLASYFAGTITPGRVGELSRVGYLRAHDVPIWESAFSTVADRALDIAALGLLAMMGAIVLLDGWSPWVLTFGTAIGCVTIALTWRRGIERVPALIRRLLPQRWGERLHDPANALVQGLGNNRAIVGSAVGWTALSWGLVCIQVLLMAGALHIEADAAQLVGAYSLAAVVGALPITVAGVGTRDAALVITFGLAGLPAETAIAFSSGVLLLYVFQGILCMPFWLHVPVKRTDTPVMARVATEA